MTRFRTALALAAALASSASAADKLKIVTTIPDLADMTSQVGGDYVDVTSIAKDESRRTVYGYRAVAYDIPQGNAAGYMPELNVLCGITDFSTQSEQPVTKHLAVEVTSVS